MTYERKTITRTTGEGSLKTVKQKTDIWTQVGEAFGAQGHNSGQITNKPERKGMEQNRT